MFIHKHSVALVSFSDRDSENFIDLHGTACKLEKLKKQSASILNKHFRYPWGSLEIGRMSA